VKGAAGAAILGLALAAGMAPAQADTRPTKAQCMDLWTEVGRILRDDPSAPNADAARSERSSGLRSCNAGVYANGVSHLKEALRLLGAQAKN